MPILSGEMTAERHENRPDSIDALRRAIAVLVAERQALRGAGADALALEQNRLAIARAQQELSAALIARHVPAAA